VYVTNFLNLIISIQCKFLCSIHGVLHSEVVDITIAEARGYELCDYHWLSECGVDMVHQASKWECAPQTQRNIAAVEKIFIRVEGSVLIACSDIVSVE